MLGLLVATVGIMHGLDCDLSDSAVIELKWDIFASETGLFTVEGCEGVSPTLHLNIQQEYKFLQQDTSNWYHPVGFAYEPGGAHNTCPPDHPEECPELEGDAIQYYFKGEAVNDDESGFGLDAYEPFFFYPRDAWEEECGGGGCYVTLNVPNANVNTIFYFCHIHKAMSAKIVLKGAEAGASPQFLDLLPPAPEITAFDEACGTWNSEPYTSGGQKYQYCNGKHFLCGGDQDSAFNTCLAAIDCQMHQEMAVDTSPNRWATFIRQMIPHHLNAVGMAKLIIKQSTFEEDGEGDSEGYDELQNMAHEIINAQNAQITLMRGWLERYEASSSTQTEMCYDKCGHKDMGGRRLLFSSQPEPGC